MPELLTQCVTSETGMAEKIAMTEKRMKEIPIPKSRRAYVYDLKTPGLVACVTPTGAKSFQLYRRGANGRPTRIALGRWPETTVEQARERAIKQTAAILDGKNPNAVKRRHRAGITF